MSESTIGQEPDSATGERHGIEPGLVRLSVGPESIDDILADLEAGFRTAKEA